MRGATATQEADGRTDRSTDADSRKDESIMDADRTTSDEEASTLSEFDIELIDGESAELFRLARTDERAREHVVASYYPMAEYLARRFAGRGEPIEDLVQVASIGLLKAVDRFDPEKGVQFSTYATPTIVGELKRHLRDKGWALRIPRRMKENGLKVRQVIADLTQELGRSPTVSEVAERSALPDEDVLEAMDAVHAYSVDSLDSPGPDDSRPFDQKRYATDDDGLEVAEGWADVAPLLRALPARERRVLFLRFARGMTQSEIAEDLGISQMHVSRLLARTIESIREQLDDGDAD